MRETIVKFIILIMIIALAIMVVNSTYSKYYGEVQGDGSLKVGKWVIKVNDTDITELPNTLNEVEKNDYKLAYQKFAKIDENYFVWNGSAVANHVSANKIAPGMSGYFDIEIDSQECETSFVYKVVIDDSKLLVPNCNLKITKVVINGNEYNSDLLRIPLTEELIVNDDEGNVIEHSSYRANEVGNMNVTDGTIASLPAGYKKCVNFENTKLYSSDVKKDIIRVYVDWENTDGEKANDYDSYLGNQVNNKLVLPVYINFIQYTGLPEDAVTM